MKKGKEFRHSKELYTVQLVSGGAEPTVSEGASGSGSAYSALIFAVACWGILAKTPTVAQSICTALLGRLFSRDSTDHLITSADDPTANRHIHNTSTPASSAKMYYFLSFASFLILVLLVAYYHRRSIAPRLPSRMQHYMPLSSFEDQANAGLTSAHFDIESLNIMGGDSRQGLDEAGAEEVKRIMSEEGVG
ncbi:hypothetical protein FS749_009348 [Ceratobasidium sp. UAMH 11750]|nr:hypothetical protein FS749_009348 [Ceratobasidium sp. UAMH 11750]